MSDSAPPNSGSAGAAPSPTATPPSAPVQPTPMRTLRFVPPPLRTHFRPQQFNHQTQLLQQQQHQSHQHLQQLQAPLRLPSREQVQKEYRQELVIRERRAARARRHRLEQIQRMAVRLPVITVDTSKAKSNIEVLRLCLRDLGWKEFPFGRKDFGCDIYWHSVSFHDNPEVVTGKVNKFPGMNEVVRKVNLFRTLETMRNLFPDDFNFYPRTWYLPAQYDLFAQEVKTVMDKYQRQRRTFIVKPDEGSQGEGIYLIRDPSEYMRTERRMIVQEYLDKPFLLDNLKFDLRIYVLLTSLEPLEFYVYKEGLARFCTVPYSRPSYRNLNEHFMHLTNYSLNKHSNTYVHTDNQEDGSKRTLSSVFKELERQGHSRSHIWREVETLIVKTMISIAPELKIEMSGEVPPGKPGPSCFQILGFDVLLLHDLKPMLLEVNASPSMRIDFDGEERRPGIPEYIHSRVDEEIKRPLIRETLRIIAPKKKWKRVKGTSLAPASPLRGGAGGVIGVAAGSSPPPTSPPAKQRVAGVASGSRAGVAPASAAGAAAAAAVEEEKENGGNELMSLIYPAAKFRFCDRFRVMDRVATLFYYGVGVRGSLRMAMTGLRNVARKCNLVDVVVSNADLDVLYVELTKRWSSLGLCYQAFVEAVFLLARKRRRESSSSSSASSSADGVDGALRILKDFLDFCEKHLQASKLPKLAVRLRHSDTLPRHPPLPPLAAAAARDKDAKTAASGGGGYVSKAMVARVADMRSIYGSAGTGGGVVGGGGGGGDGFPPSPVTRSSSFHSRSSPRSPNKDHNSSTARSTPMLPIMGK